MTLKQLAALANVSVSTVSKAFSDSKDIGAAQRERILTLAKEHGVYEKYYKGKFGKTVIAVIFPEIISGFYSAFFKVLAQKLQDRNALMIFAVTDFNDSKTEEQIRYFGSFHHADGILAFSSATLKNPSTVPLVVLGEGEADCVSDTVSFSLTRGIDEAVRYLKNSGHKRVGYIGEPLTRVKEEMVKRAMRKCGVGVYDEHFVTVNQRFAAAGYVGMQTILAQSPRPTAVICAYDDLAVGAIRCVHEAGLCVPEDISVIGMDNQTQTEYVQPRLSSVGVQIDEICEKAVSLLFEKIENKYIPARKTVCNDSCFVRRDSAK